MGGRSLWPICVCFANAGFPAHMVPQARKPEELAADGAHHRDDVREVQITRILLQKDALLKYLQSQIGGNHP